MDENSPNGCADKCFEVKGDNCTGFYYREILNRCALPRQIHDIMDSPTSCYYYIIDKTDTAPDRPDLNARDKLVNAAAYKTPTDPCPFTWILNGSYCTHTVPLSANCTNYQYADFFGVFFNAPEPKVCLMPARVSHLCPVETWIGLVHSQEGIGYCYPEVTVDAGHDIDYYTQICRNITTDTDMISIHSPEENDFIRDNIGPTMLGLHIPGGVWSPSDFVWSDGSALDYTNWDSSPIQPDNADGNEFFTSLIAAGTWKDQQSFDTTVLRCRKIIYDYTYY